MEGGLRKKRMGSGAARHCWAIPAGPCGPPRLLKGPTPHLLPPSVQPFLSPLTSCLTSEGLQEYLQGNFPLTYGLGENHSPSCRYPVKLYVGRLGQGQRHWFHGFGGLRFDRGCSKQSQLLPHPKLKLPCASLEFRVKNHNLYFFGF